MSSSSLESYGIWIFMKQVYLIDLKEDHIYQMRFRYTAGGTLNDDLQWTGLVTKYAKALLSLTPQGAALH